MAIPHGKDSYFAVDTKDLTTYLTDITFNNSTDMAESTTMGAEAKTYVAGLTDGTISISGRYDPTATTGPDAVLSGLRGGETAVVFEYGPAGNASGAVKH